MLLKYHARRKGRYNYHNELRIEPPSLDFCAMHNILICEQGFLFMPSLGVSSLDLTALCKQRGFF